MLFGWQTNADFCLGVAVAAFWLNRICKPYGHYDSRSRCYAEQQYGAPAPEDSGAGRQVAGDQNNAHENSKRFLGPFTAFEAAQVMFTAALVGVGVLQFLVYRNQADIMETQAKISRDQLKLAKAAYVVDHRAYIYFDPSVRVSVPETKYGSEDAWAVLMMTNGGSALPVKIHVETWCFIRPLDEEIGDNYNRYVPGVTDKFVGPKQSVYAATCLLSKQNLNDIRSKIDNFFLGVRATYPDTVDPTTAHVTEGCLQVVGIADRPLTPGTGLGSSAIPCPGNHNCADEQCKTWVAASGAQEGHQGTIQR